MKRIVIIGNSGSGKSTFAKKLSIKLGINVIHLDNLYYRLQRKSKSTSDWDNIQKEIVRKQKWIIEGNFPRTWDIRIEAADTVIFFEFPIWLSFIRVVVRWIFYRATNRPDMPKGAKEKININDLKKILTFPKSTLIKKKINLNKTKLIIFKNNTESNNFIDSLNDTMGGLGGVVCTNSNIDYIKKSILMKQISCKHKFVIKN